MGMSTLGQATQNGHYWVKEHFRKSVKEIYYRSQNIRENNATANVSIKPDNVYNSKKKKNVLDGKLLWNQKNRTLQDVWLLKYTVTLLCVLLQYTARPGR